ncbi:MAG: hypothetical protein ABI123_09945 [Ginsengibacter sp.]|jgi:hypothetical protein
MDSEGENVHLKRIKNRYRLVVMNEDSFQEVVAFKLNRWSVYTVLSGLFVIIIGLTIGLVAFTPLKYYIPGFGQEVKTKEFEVLKVRADSIERALIINQQYVDEIGKVLKGNVISHDTNTLKVNPDKGERIVKPKKRRRR